MLEIYFSDVEEFEKSDWEDMLDNPIANAYTDWKGWHEGKRAVFQVGEDDAWENVPVKEFAVNQDGEGEKAEFSEELSGLLSDLASLHYLKSELCRTRLYDRTFDDEVDHAAGLFFEAYDRAAARALAMLVRELFEARGQ